MTDLRDDPVLKTLLAEAAREGARQALAEIGLHDEEAVADVRDLRQFITALRLMKKGAWGAVGGVVGKVVLLALLVGALWLAGFKPPDWLKPH